MATRRAYATTLAKLLLAVISLLAGLDDLWEAIEGTEDIFGLDVHHGVIALAILAVFEHVADFITEVRDTHDSLKAARDERRR